MKTILNLQSDYFIIKSSLLAEHLASIYFEKLPGIIDAMIPELIDFYGETIKGITRDAAIEKLGKPSINLELDIINFPNQTSKF